MYLPTADIGQVSHRATDRSIHRPLDPRATRITRQPRALVRCVAVEIIAEPVFEEGVEVQEQPVATAAGYFATGGQWEPLRIRRRDCSIMSRDRRLNARDNRIVSSVQRRLRQ